MIYLEYKGYEIYFWKNGSPLWIYFSPDLGSVYHHGTEELEETMNLIKEEIDSIIEFSIQCSNESPPLPDNIVF